MRIFIFRLTCKGCGVPLRVPMKAMPLNMIGPFVGLSSAVAVNFLGSSELAAGVGCIALFVTEHFIWRRYMQLQEGTPWKPIAVFAWGNRTNWTLSLGILLLVIWIACMSYIDIRNATGVPDVRGSLELRLWSGYFLVGGLVLSIHGLLQRRKR